MCFFMLWRQMACARWVAVCMHLEHLDLGPAALKIEQAVWRRHNRPQKALARAGTRRKQCAAAVASACGVAPSCTAVLCWAGLVVGGQSYAVHLCASVCSRCGCMHAGLVYMPCWVMMMMALG